MNTLSARLPSNRKFGLFFTFVFGATAIYFYNYSSILWAQIFTMTSAIFLTISLTKDEILSPLNKIWMKLGLLLGFIVSPVILGLVFFGLFTPIAVIMRISGRDELRLKLKKKPSCWIARDELSHSNSFKLQF